MQQLVTFAASSTTTPHRGFLSFQPETGAHSPVTLCRTRAAGLAPLGEGATPGRICQNCERGEAVLDSLVLRPEVRLLAGARSSAAGHFRIEGDGRAYCGKQLGEDTPASDKVCKVCDELRAHVATFTQAFESETAGYEVELDAPLACSVCSWVGRYAPHSTRAHDEWRAHEADCAEEHQEQAAEVEVAEADEAPVEVPETWHCGFLAADTFDPGALFDLPHDAEQGALFA